MVSVLKSVFMLFIRWWWLVSNVLVWLGVVLVSVVVCELMLRLLSRLCCVIGF